MSDITQEHKAIYTSHDVSSILKIQESTLRKYCLLLEELGYQFHKNDNKQRGFYDGDVIALKKLIKLKNTPNMTLKQAGIAVMTWKYGDSVTEPDTSAQRHNELLERFEKLEEFNKVLIDQLKKQQEIIDHSLKERDRALIEALKESMEHQKLIATSVQEEKEKETAAKKQWWEFWK